MVLEDDVTQPRGMDVGRSVDGHRLFATDFGHEVGILVGSLAAEVVRAMPSSAHRVR